MPSPTNRTTFLARCCGRDGGAAWTNRLPASYLTAEWVGTRGDRAAYVWNVTADHRHVFTNAGYPHRGNDILGLVKDVPDVDGTAPAPSKDKNGLPYTTLGYQNGPGYRGPAARPDLTSVNTAALDFRQEAAVPLDSETHAGEDVALYATGPRAHLVRGSMEQNWIFHVMREAFGW